MAARDASFETERITFESKRASWVRRGREGRWMAVKGTNTLGPFDRFGEAWDAAVKKFGDTHVLVERVLRRDRPPVVSWIGRSAKR